MYDCCNPDINCKACDCTRAKAVPDFNELSGLPLATELIPEIVYQFIYAAICSKLIVRQASIGRAVVVTGLMVDQGLVVGLEPASDRRQLADPDQARPATRAGAACVRC